jgi:Transcriptional regulator
VRNTREQLLDAATRVLLRDGAEHVTLEAVAAEAGVSKGGLLYHFSSKPALVAALVDRLVGRFDAALQSCGDQPGAATRVYLGHVRKLHGCDSTVNSGSPCESRGRCC